MAKITGLGGIFFKCKDPKGTRDWYRDKLGLDTNDYGATFEWRDMADPQITGATQWSTFPDTTKYLDPSDKPFMINYRVDDIESMIFNLRAAGVSIVGEIQNSDYGKFAHVMDPEGVKIELWEPAITEGE